MTKMDIAENRKEVNREVNRKANREVNKKVNREDNRKVNKKVNREDKREVSQEARMKKREEERALRRELRRKKVRRQRIAILSVCGVVLIACAAVLLFALPGIRVSRKLSAGDKYTLNQEYDMAQTAYEEALAIDSTVVKAYRCMAENDLAQDDSTAAKEILFTGWETTQDESLLKYYCTVLLNEAIEELNNQTCDMGTVEKCVQVLEKSPTTQDIYTVLDTCYERLFVAENQEACTLFLEMNMDEEAKVYTAYEQNMRRMLAVYKANPSAKLEQYLLKYLLLDIEEVQFCSKSAQSYYELLKETAQTVQNEKITQTIAALEDAMEKQQFFAAMFDEFAMGNFESAKDFILTEEYQKLRDDFIGGTQKYWAGNHFMPINQENIVLHHNENGCQYSFLDYAEYEKSLGVITVWGNEQMDDGVQRTTISYEPMSENGEYYPHIEYTISYGYTNVGKAGQHMPQMNFHFETRKSTEEGTELYIIGDWGGEHEWEMSS